MLKRIFLVILLLNFYGFIYAQSSDEPVIYLTPESHTADNSDDADIDDDLVDNDNAGANALKPVTSPPAEKPKPTYYGPITKQDHIYALAKKFHFDTHVTMQQIMIAILHQNPQAFANNNVNEMIPGSMLTIPTLAQIELIPADLAKALVLEQDHQWQKVQVAQLEKVKQAKFLAVQIAKQKIAERTAEEKDAKEKIAAEKKAAAEKAAVNNKILQPIPPQYSVQAANLSAQYNKEIENLQQKLTTNEENFNKYEATMQQRLVSVEHENLAKPQVALPQENKIIPVVKKLDTQPTTETKKHTVSYLLPNNKISWWILWAAAFLIVLIWMPSKKKSATTERQEPIVSLKNAAKEEKTAIENEDEYDFMNSQEAMPAKLDLARAYIDMEDFASAKMLLEEILNKGNETECKEAKKILRSIKTRV